MSNHKSAQRFLRNLRLIVKCGICGHRQKIQFHHIKPTELNGVGRGLWRRAKDIKDHPDCYIPLCYFCHQKVTLKETFIHPRINSYGWETLWYSFLPYWDHMMIGNDRIGVIHVI